MEKVSAFLVYVLIIPVTYAREPTSTESVYSTLWEYVETLTKNIGYSGE